MLSLAGYKANVPLVCHVNSPFAHTTQTMTFCVSVMLQLTML